MFIFIVFLQGFGSEEPSGDYISAATTLVGAKTFTFSPPLLLNHVSKYQHDEKGK